MRNPGSLLIPALSASLLFLLVGCTLNTDYFSEYRGTNLLANHDFGATGAWALVTESTNYMTWEDAGTTGPDGTSPAYRLEIDNLVANGDFEDTSVTAEGATSLPSGTGWSLVRDYNTSTTGTGRVEYALTHSTNLATTAVSFPSALTIDHRSLLFSAQTSGDQLALNLSTALGSLWLAGQYEFRFDLINGTTTKNFGLAMVALANTTPVYDWDLTETDGLTLIGTGSRVGVYKTFTVKASTTPGASPDPQFLVWGKGGTTSDAGILDNVRVIPADKDLAVMLTFASLKSGGLQLLPGSQTGMYTFTVQVLDDATADQTGTAATHTNNRFYPSGLMVTVEGMATNGAMTVLAQSFTARPSGGWTGWTTITLEGGLDFIASDNDLNGNPALRIRLSPTDQISALGKDAGSLLVAQPTLTFNP